MKKVRWIKYIFVIVMLLLLSTEVFSQILRLEKAKLVETLVPVYGKNNEILSRKIEYTINCALVNATEEDSVKFRDAANWKVYADEQLLTLEKIVWTQVKPNAVKLIGPFKDQDKLTVEFLESKPVLVDVHSAIVGQTKWGVGKGKAVDYNVQRLAKQQAFFAFEYDFATNILERYLTVPKGKFWIRSLSLNLVSNGTVGSDNEVRNGTQSSLDAAVNPYYFIGGLVYQGKLSLSYQMETQQASGEDKIFNVLNKHLKFGMEVEIPYTNYPFVKLHSKTGYARLAMPLTLSVAYLPEGEDDAGDETLARMDFKAHYEFAFSPYLIIQPEWHYSYFFDAPAGSEKDASYYSVTFAQDFDVIREFEGLLKLMMGLSGTHENPRGKHFIFYKISSGRKAPSFQDIREYSFGFGTYL